MMKENEGSKGEGRGGHDEEREPFDLGELNPAHALELVSDLARESPHAAVAGAFAVGFLLAGGLTPRLLGALGLMAARRYVAQSVREAVEVALHEAPPRSVEVH